MYRCLLFLAVLSSTAFGQTAPSLSQLSNLELCAQVQLVRLPAEGLTPEWRAVLAEQGVGGVVLRAPEHFVFPEELPPLVEAIRSAVPARLPAPLIFVEPASGYVARLYRAAGFVALPPDATLEAGASSAERSALYLASALDLARFGVDVLLCSALTDSPVPARLVGDGPLSADSEVPAYLDEGLRAALPASAVDDVLISGPLDGDIVAAAYRADHAATRALTAGCSLLYWAAPTPDDLRARAAALELPLRTGALTREDIEARVAAVQALRGATSSPADAPPSRESVARSAVRLLRGEAGDFLEEGDQQLAVIAPGTALRTEGGRTLLLERTLCDALRRYVPTAMTLAIGEAPLAEEHAQALRLADQADRVVVGVLRAAKSPPQQELVRALLRAKPETVVVLLGNPEEAALFPNARTVLLTHGAGAESMDAAAAALFGDFIPKPAEQ